MKSKRPSPETWAENARLLKLRTELEDDLSDKKLPQDKRKKLEAELAKTRAAIRLMPVARG